MKRVGFFMTSCVIAVATLPAIAQQSPAPVSPGPGYGYGYGHMWGWQPGFFIGPIVMLLILAGLIAFRIGGSLFLSPLPRRPQRLHLVCGGGADGARTGEVSDIVGCGDGESRSS